MIKLTPAEQNAFEIIMSFIEDYDALNIKTYDSVVEMPGSALDEQYFNDARSDMFCFKDRDDKGKVSIYLKNRDYEDFNIHVYPTNDDGSRIVNFMYTYDEAEPTDEWYEKKPYWFADFNLKVFGTEEEYFQQSTVHELYLSSEENDMIIKFVNDFHSLLNSRVMRKRHGQST